MLAWIKRRADQRLQERVSELETELAVKDRTIAVQQVELEQLAAVAARDRARIAAESAAYGRARADAEGMKHG